MGAHPPKKGRLGHPPLKKKMLIQLIKWVTGGITLLIPSNSAGALFGKVSSRDANSKVVANVTSNDQESNGHGG